VITMKKNMRSTSPSPYRTIAVAVSLAALLPVVARAIVPVSYVTSAMTPFTVNDGPGNQTDPHISGGLVSYTSDLSIRYFNVESNTDAAVPQNGGVRDTLSNVSGSRIVFSRQFATGASALMVFDTSMPASDPVEIDPAPATTRLGSAIGGDTIAYVDFGLEPSGELIVHDLSTSGSTRLTNDTALDVNPAVSADGNVVVWEHCPTTQTNCDIWQAVRTGPSWTVTVAAANAAPESNPDTNGVTVVYESNRSGNSDIYWRSVAGGAETQLQLPGIDVNPNIAGNLIAFESRATIFDATDLFVYDVPTNRLFQLTNTPLVNEQLSDITLLPDGRVRVVWASDEDSVDAANVHGATFTLPPATPTLTITVPATITVNATAASGAAVTYTVTASDAVDPSPVITCQPPSGSTFAIGTSAVACTATDTFGEQASATFSVVVRGASDQIGDLIGLVQSMHLPVAVSLSLEAELWVARTFAASPNPARACAWMAVFVREVQLAAGHSISSQQAAQLLAAATRIKSVLGCP
jgi:hypothetical protein